MTTIRYGAASDVGMVRPANQDSYLITSSSFAVADGMGGHAAGEVASQLALAAFRDDLPAAPSEDALRGAVSAANRAVYERSLEYVELRGMGTTLVGLALSADRVHGVLVNVGDSRAYRYRDGTLERLSRDHTYVADLVSAGQLTEAEARTHPQRHIVTRALGIEPGVEIDTWLMDLVIGDRYLLCSDGLFGEVPDSTIAAILAEVEDPQQVADLLVGTANAMGGHDNVTVIVVDIVEGEEAVPLTAAPVATPVDPIVTTVVEEPAPVPVEAELHDDITVIAPRVAPVAPPPVAPVSPIRRAGPKRRRRWVGAIMFVVAVLGIFGIAIAAITWYGRSTFFVGVHDGKVTLFRGRPGGVLWIEPTIEKTYDVRRDDLRPSDRARVDAGTDVRDTAAGDQYVRNLLNAATTTTTTAAPTTTTAPTTSTAPTTTAVPSSTP
jgi:serine/threonine protein phosphatase PrpC